MVNILILCTGNSCRSVMTEGLLNHYGADRLQASSAGSFPTGYIHPISLVTLKKHGICDVGYYSKSWDEFKDKPIDIVITVCDNAAGETCPLFVGNPIKAHWGVPDPAHCKGDENEIQSEFDRIFLLLKKRVDALLAFPFEKLSKQALEQELNKIGNTDE